MSRLSILTQDEWNVLTHISLAASPTTVVTLSLISLAALFVKVIASIFHGLTPFAIRFAILTVSAPVFPEPAPARIRTGPSVFNTAFFCIGFKVSKLIIIQNSPFHI